MYWVGILAYICLVFPAVAMAITQPQVAFGYFMGFAFMTLGFVVSPVIERLLIHLAPYLRLQVERRAVADLMNHHNDVVWVDFKLGPETDIWTWWRVRQTLAFKEFLSRMLPVTGAVLWFLMSVRLLFESLGVSHL